MYPDSIVLTMECIQTVQFIFLGSLWYMFREIYECGGSVVLLDSLLYTGSLQTYFKPYCIPVLQYLLLYSLHFCIVSVIISFGSRLQLLTQLHASDNILHILMNVLMNVMHIQKNVLMNIMNILMNLLMSLMNIPINVLMNVLNTLINVLMNVMNKLINVLMNILNILMNVLMYYC